MTLLQPKEVGWVHGHHSGSGSDFAERSAPSILQLQDLMVCGRNIVKFARAFIAVKTQLREAAPAKEIGRCRFNSPALTLCEKQQIQSIILPNTLAGRSCPDLHPDLRPERLTCLVGVKGLPCLQDAAGLGQWEASSRDMKAEKRGAGVLSRWAWGWQWLTSAAPKASPNVWESFPAVVSLFTFWQFLHLHTYMLEPRTDNPSGYCRSQGADTSLLVPFQPAHTCTNGPFVPLSVEPLVE